MKITLFIYLIVVNATAFVLYGVDKYKARNKRWRIPEKRLLQLAMIGGGVGAYCGMMVFRHKTKHRRFNIIVPLSAIIWILALYYLMTPTSH